MESKKVFLVSIVQKGKFLGGKVSGTWRDVTGRIPCRSTAESQRGYRALYREFLHRELAKGTLLDILHQTGLNKDDLIEFLK